MASDYNDDELDANGGEAEDEWDEFRGEEGDPIGIEELKQLGLREMPEDIRLWVMDNYFPETTVWRNGDILICEIQEHLYTKYWEHKFSAYAFAEAMERAARRHVGSPMKAIHLQIHHGMLRTYIFLLVGNCACRVTLSRSWWSNR
jgi:hypothetical protein